MNKNEFVDMVYSRSGLTKKDCRQCLDTIIEVIKDVLRTGDSVTIAKFGKFKVNQIKSKSIYNFKTKDTHFIESRKNPTFKASDHLKEIIK